MNPELFDQRMSAYLDGELSESERAEVDELLRTSDEHRQALAEVTAIREELKNLPRYSLDSGFASRVIAAAERAEVEQEQVVLAEQNNTPVALPARGKNWLFVAVALGAAAACVALVIALSNEGGPIAQPLPEGPGAGNPGVAVAEAAPQASEFARLLTSASEKSEAVIVRIKLTKADIRGKVIDKALQAQGIAIARSNPSNAAAQEASKNYRDLVKGQTAGSSASKSAGDVLFLEADPANLEQALRFLSKESLIAEARIASTAEGLKEIKAEGEPGSENSSSPETKIPAAGYAQHLPPRGFTLPAAPASVAPQTAAVSSSKKLARVLIVVEVAD